jgi:hypothetical protein
MALLQLVWLGTAGIIKPKGRDAAKLRLWHQSRSPLPPLRTNQEDENPILDCGCVGFFSEYDGINALVPTIDHLVEKGWEILKD